MAKRTPATIEMQNSMEPNYREQPPEEPLPEETLQRSYYASTASDYDRAHVSSHDEHSLALAILAALVKFHGYESVLDVGSGTGRAVQELGVLCPGLRCVGVEPVAALRQLGYSKGLSEESLVDGNGTRLPFPDNSFDVVCEFAVLHHVPKSQAVIQEMSRVARRMIFVSDCNFVAQGNGFVRLIKRFLFGLKVWPLVKWIKSGGRGYSVSHDDGIHYSYSVFQDVKFLRRFWNRLYTFPTAGESGNSGSLLLSAPHLLVVCSEKK